MILNFSGAYRFLSNFWNCGIWMKREENNILFHSSEAVYQAMKTLTVSEQDEIRLAKTPGNAKRLGKKVTLRPDWTTVIVDGKTVQLLAMEIAVMEKFKQNPQLKELLFKTNGKYLLEGNYWHDNFWGEYQCPSCKSKTKGQNNLGIILMALRETLK